MIRQTIQNRLKRAVSAHNAHATQQKMPPKLEDIFVQWILVEDRAGQAPNYARMRAMTEKILQSVRLPTGLGENWHKWFKARHPDIRMINVHHVEAERINACNSEMILAFFERLKTIKDDYKINNSNMYNVDETGT